MKKATGSIRIRRSTELLDLNLDYSIYTECRALPYFLLNPTVAINSSLDSEALRFFLPPNASGIRWFSRSSLQWQ